MPSPTRCWPATAKAAERIVREAIEAGLAEALIDDDVIRPALVLVGDLWAEGRISVADEHLATSISVRVTRSSARRSGSSRAAPVGASCSPGSRASATSSASRWPERALHAGYDVRMFGADLPVASIAAAVERHRPAVVGFTARRWRRRSNLPAAVEEVRRGERDHRDPRRRPRRGASA